MNKRRDQRGGMSGLALVAAAVFVLFAGLYVLGIGPATWLGENYEETQEFVATIYLPLALLAESCQPIGRALAWYVELWI